MIKNLKNENKFILLFFLLPIIFGYLFSVIFNIDLSAYLINHIGLLEYVDSSGYELKTRSTILVFSFLFSPLIWAVFINDLSSGKEKKRDKIKSLNVFYLIFLIFLMLLFSYIIYLIMFNGLPVSSNPGPGGRAMQFLISYEVTFGLICSMFLLVFQYTLFSIIRAIYEVIRRILSFINSVGSIIKNG